MTAAGARPGRRSRAARLTLAGLLALPLVELVVAILIGRVIGAAPTVLMLVLASLAGVTVLRQGGTRAMRSLSAAGPVRSGTASAPDLSAAGDATWLLLGGVLLVIPGFVTAFAGLLLVFGPTRRLLGPLLGRGAGRVATRLLGAPLVGRVVGTRVVRGDVVDVTVDVETTSPAPAEPPRDQIEGRDPPAPGPGSREADPG